jgi:hypothetical protein
VVCLAEDRAGAVRGVLPRAAVQGEWDGAVVRAPHFRLDGCTLYGASAYILHELLVKLAVRLARPLPPMVLEETPPWGNRYERS